MQGSYPCGRKAWVRRSAAVQKRHSTNIPYSDLFFKNNAFLPFPCAHMRQKGRMVISTSPIKAYVLMHTQGKGNFQATAIGEQGMFPYT